MVKVYLFLAIFEIITLSFFCLYNQAGIFYVGDGSVTNPEGEDILISTITTSMTF